MLVVEDDCSSGESSDHDHNHANNCKAPIPVDTDHKKITKIYNGLTSCVSDQHVHVECKEEVVGHLIGKLSIRVNHSRIHGSTDKSAVQFEKGQIYKQINIVNKITSVNM